MQIIFCRIISIISIEPRFFGVKTISERCGMFPEKAFGIWSHYNRCRTHGARLRVLYASARREDCCGNSPAGWKVGRANK